jgi:glutaredoxin
MPERLDRTSLCTGRITRALIAAIASAVLLMPFAGGAKAACSKRVYVYSAEWCGTCRRLRSYLDLNRIRYTLLDADNPRVRADMQRRFGNLAVPRTLIGRSVVSGLETAKIQTLCR